MRVWRLRMDVFQRKRAAWMTLLSLFIFAPTLAMAQMAWVKSFDAALKQAAKEKKFIVLDISATW
jgi:hypothetical protein